MKRFARLIAFVLVLAFIPFASAERLDDNTLLSFYDDSIFIGDSRMQAFRKYVALMRETDEDYLASATIVAAESIGLYIASTKYIPEEGIAFSFRGMRLTTFEIAEMVQPRKIFVLLGLNDQAPKNPDSAMGWVEAFVRRMGEAVPYAEVYFFSETPVTPLFGRKNNLPDYPDQLDVYNARLKETCEKCGAHYIEIAEALKGEDNLLKPEYSSDGVCHLNSDGVGVWVQCMKDYAQEQFDLGLWDPYAEKTPATMTDIDTAE